MVRKKISLIVLTACILCAAVFAETFVVENLDHDCTGSHCSICLQIEIAVNLLEGLSRIILFAFATCLITQIFAVSNKFLYFPILPHTLVDLKIKCNS